MSVATVETTLLLIFLALLTTANYRFGRSVLYPPFIFCAIWLLVILLYPIGLIDVESLHAETLLLISSGALLFSLGGIGAWLVPGRLIRAKIRIGDSLREVNRNHFTKNVLLGLSVIGMLFMIHWTLSLAAQGSGATILAQARNAGVEQENTGTGSISVLTYVPIWSACVATLFLIEVKDRTFWAMAFVALVIAVFTTGRVPILLLFCSLLSVHLVKTSKIGLRAALRFLRLPVLVFLILYVVLIFTTKDVSGLSGGLGGILTAFLVWYIIGPTAGLNYVLQHASEYTDLPNHTFKFPLEMAAHLHLLPYTPPPLFDSFIAAPLPTNVYTGYKFFFTDFGFWGCLGIVTIIGFSHTLLYRKALSGSALGLYLFAMMMMPLVMFIFDDLYSATGEDLNILLVGCLYMIVRPLRFLPARRPRFVLSEASGPPLPH